MAFFWKMLRIHNCLAAYLIVFALLGFQRNSLARNFTEPANIAGYGYRITGDTGNFRLRISTQETKPGVFEATIELVSKTGQKQVPPTFGLEWSLPAVNIHGNWSPATQRDRRVQPIWGAKTLSSTLASSAPVISMFGHNDQNRLTFACSDALNRVSMNNGLKEEDSRIYCSIQFFTERHKPLDAYTVKLLFDKRDIPYYESLRHVTGWWEAMEIYKPAPVPPTAKMPMYSTWYSYHKNLEEEKLLEECAAASKIGYKAIIIDDGWQSADNVRGYASTGDWKPEKLKGLAQFVQKAHQLDMKVLLWYSLPFVGVDSKAFGQFKGKTLRMADKNRAAVLDPRYPEVRKYIIDTYVQALQAYKLDGFKLDFIDNFQSNETTVLEAVDGRDYASVNEATDRLMSDVISSLRSINNDILIEFRQSYIGPLMRKYGNMFRSGDCPNSAITNRVQTTDIKLLCGNTAVHADMMEWSYEEPAELAALQLLNTIFSVPQISVRLNEVPKSHQRMIAFYNHYWMENQEVLLGGEFAAYSPLANYPLLSAKGKDKTIYALYNNYFIRLPKNGTKTIDVINANEDTTVVVISAAAKKGRYSIVDCEGKMVRQGNMELKAGANLITVPVSGLFRFMAH
jgi:alpha-galactosidase